MNQFEAAKHLYSQYAPMILAGPKNEWAMDAYEWSGKFSLTPIEYNIWCEIRMANAVMYPQYPVGKYFVDFGNPVAKVAIECDGKAFHMDRAKDDLRQSEIEAMGWTVYRISGRDCNSTSPDDEEDEYGNPVMAPSTATLFVREVVNVHGVVRNTSKSTDFFGGVFDWLSLTEKANA